MHYRGIETSSCLGFLCICYSGFVYAGENEIPRHLSFLSGFEQGAKLVVVSYFAVFLPNVICFLASILPSLVSFSTLSSGSISSSACGSLAQFSLLR